jgi:hypothetical protein
MPPSLARHADGRLIALAVAPVGFGIQARSQIAPNGAWGDWTDFEAFGGDAPILIANPDGRLEVFVLAGGGTHIQHRWQNAPSGTFSAWEDFDGGPAMCTPTVPSRARPTAESSSSPSRLTWTCGSPT